MCPEPLRPGDVRCRLVGDAFGAEFEEPRVGVVHEGDVEAVDPGHRLLGLVVMAVEVPSRSEQEITTTHRYRITVDDGPHSLALHHESERILAVPVFGGGLVRAEVLDGGPQ